MAIEYIAVTLLVQERSPQPPQQEAKFRLRPAANCRHQSQDTVSLYFGYTKVLSEILIR